MEKDKDTYIINNKRFHLYIPQNEIDRVISDLAERINQDYSGKSLVCLLVLKGSIFFGADLMKKLNIDCLLEVIRTSSYGDSMTSSGKVEIDLSKIDIKDKDVLIIEDIIDSGRTMSELMKKLNALLPRSLQAVSMLSKPAQREVDVPVKYIGKEIPPLFVIGYGLDYDEQGRHLPDIYAYE